MTGDAVCGITQRDLPPLKQQLDAILREIGAQS